MKLACLQIFLCCFVLLCAAHAQPSCKVEQYSTEDGLSHQRITSILKDKEGFMWFGTWNGINRFDGRTFVSYKSAPGDEFQLRNERIDQMVDDSSSNLWVLAYDNQVYQFSKQTEQFFSIASLPFFKEKRITFSKILAADKRYVWLQTSSNGVFCIQQADAVSAYTVAQYSQQSAPGYRLPSDSISSFWEDKEHTIWIGTAKGLCHLERTASGSYSNIPVSIPGIHTQTGITVVDEDAGALYSTTADGVLVVYHKQKKSFSTIKIADERLTVLLHSKKQHVVYATTASGKLIRTDVLRHQSTVFQYPAKEPLKVLYEDRTGCLWIEPGKMGVIRFNPATGSFRSFPSKNNEVFSPLGNRFKVFEDKDGLVWVNLKGGGFGYFNPTNDSIEYEINTPNEPNYALPTFVYNTYYDTDGILWLTTYERELIKIVLQDNNFRQLRFVEKSSSQANNEIRGIYSDRQGRLWMGSKSGKLYVYQNGIRVQEVFEKETENFQGHIYAILQDSRGNVWLGTKTMGLYKATPTNVEQTKYRLSHFSLDKNTPDSLQCRDIYALLEDKQGRIWIGSFDNGLSLIVDDGNDTKFVHCKSAFQRYPKAGFNRIRHMELDSQGNIWMGTTDGLLVLDANGKTTVAHSFATYSKRPNQKESLGNNDVQYVYRDAKGSMWLGTSGGGFCKAVGQHPLQAVQFINYTTREGMPNDYVLSCISDQQGNLWIATENGLTKFDPGQKVFRNYDTYDGFPKASFSESSVSKRLSDGQLFFGTTTGVLAFNPATIKTKKIAANIVFTSLHINNEPVGPGPNELAVEKDINYLPALRLKYFQNIISIDYALLDYRSGNRQVFAYRLLGFDSTWHDDRQQQRVTYTNLPPGKYVFEVKNSNNDRYSNQPFKRLAITILPPPWRTWWAYILYVVAFAAVVFYIRRTAIAIIRLRNKVAVEQKLAALKLNFFTNISHELRTPLTLIASPLEQLARKEKLSPEGISNIEVARKNTDRMGRFINQLLDLRKVQSNKAVLRISRVEIVALVRKVADHFAELISSKQIAFSIDADTAELLAWVDIEKLDVVIYNLLGNAFKFTPSGKGIRVMIRNLPEEQCFSIAVCDQGPGIAPAETETIFELFQEGKQTEANISKGTGIGLALSREFIHLHGGTIWAANNKEGGLTVSLKLNTDKAHYKHGEVLFMDTPESVLTNGAVITKLIPSPAGSASISQNQQAARVLLVEDNDELRTFLQRQLSENYRVDIAKDGREGLEKATELLPDLILSDIMMPNMDGIQLLDKVKNSVATSHIPVVLLSAKYSIESQIEGLKYGADSYLTKPFNNEVLMASIDNLLRQRKKLFQTMVKQPEQVVPEPKPEVITSKDELFLKEVIQVVEDKMADADFNIEAIADSMAMSRTTFYKKFKSLTASTPVEFVRDMRLSRARQHLDTGSNNISEVAYQVGFSNPKYFSTCFKEKYQVSPSDYLKEKEG